jgi:hypothetical protein
MRLPRVRITVRSLILAIAVVAVNFAAFRRFYDTDRYTGGRISYRLLPAEVGVLPLFNVALIGTWLFASGWLRRLRHGRVHDPRSSWSGVGYLGLHFLVLGWLVYQLMPDTVTIVRMGLDAATECVAVAWGAVFREPNGTVPWVVVVSAMLGLILSGPPLLLSWVGQVLAKRCAATLPRWRLRVMAGLVELGFAAAALAVCLTPQPFEEELDVDVDIQVVDDVSGRPIASAFVCMTDPFALDTDATTPRAFTGADGRARLTGRFVATGQRNAFRTMADVSPWGRWLEIAAAGHRTRRVPLSDMLGPFVDPVRPGLGKVALTRGWSPDLPFRDLAGIYAAGGNGFGGSWFALEPDGRFAWCKYGCVPPDVHEYGYVKRHGRELDLVLVPHPGREVHPLVTARYRVVEWGARLYLTTADDCALLDVCREALTPDRPLAGDSYGMYLRQSDRDRPRTGLPRLPAWVWVAFLADELRLDNEDGSLSRALAWLTPKALRRPSTGRGRSDRQGG